MKKIILTFIVFAFLANVSAQLKVDRYGNILLGSSSSNFFGTTGNFPLIFKVNNVLAGFTGTQDISNVSFGFGAFLKQPAGISNAAIGYYAYASATTGSYNSALGNAALCNNTSGDGNTATGSAALYLNTTGNCNTADGNNALGNNTTGSYNSAVGHTALYVNTTGSCNTAIGFNAGGNADNLTNSTAIGWSSIATSSNQVMIGNSMVSWIGGYANWSNLSDGRAKKNIKADVPGLDFINLLQPVTYNLDLDAMDNLLGIDKAKKEKLEKDMPQDLKDKNEKAKKAKEALVQTGFVAQDVEKTAKSIGYDFSGVNVDEKGIYSLSYAEFVVPLVKAVQELSAQNEQLQQQINELKGNGAALRSSSNETGTTGMVNPAVAQCKLYQNTPNPFNQSTQIKYYLPQDVKTAYLYIYNLQGAQIKQFRITQRGEGVQLISASELVAGMYLFTLIADGQEIDTKRMILTK